jgi:hypothetical protein
MSLVRAALSALRSLVAGEERAWRVLATAVAACVLVGLLQHVLGPMLADFSTYGFHDWDVATAYRYITVLSLSHGEAPWWHPYLCGGVQAWGYSEGATNFVSPYLPLYYWADVRTAIRVEVFGQGLLGLAGAYAFASSFTTSRALRAFLAALWVLNGRWALQAAVGHTWHLQYALLPWALFFFERALARPNLRWAAAAGSMLALQCYWGGIYPLPHTALFLALYALLRAGLERSSRALVALGVVAFVSVGLSAPKLFAALDQLQVLPRLIESKEVIDLADLYAMLTLPDQRYGVHPIRVPAYNWHEWGIYVGPVGVLALAIGVGYSRGAAGNAYRILGLLALMLGLGAFHPASPWALLHELPLFASQHVPSRFHYPMLLFLGAAFVIGIKEGLESRLRVRPWLDAALLVPVALFGWDLARYSRTPFEQAFWMRAPENIQRAEVFEHRMRSPVSYVARDWAEPALLPMFANVGVVRCYGVDPAFKPHVVPRGMRNYRGTTFVDGEGDADIVDWTPNRAVVELAGVTPGELVVYNMNYDASWRANGEAALSYRGLVAARAPATGTRIEFRYVPRTLAWSLPLFLLTLAAVVVPRRLFEALLRRMRGRTAGAS